MYVASLQVNWWIQVWTWVWMVVFPKHEQMWRTGHWAEGGRACVSPDWRVRVCLMSLSALRRLPCDLRPPAQCEGRPEGHRSSGFPAHGDSDSLISRTHSSSPVSLGPMYGSPRIHRQGYSFGSVDTCQYLLGTVPDLQEEAEPRETFFHTSLTRLLQELKLRSHTQDILRKLTEEFASPTGYFSPAGAVRVTCWS